MDALRFLHAGGVDPGGLGTGGPLVVHQHRPPHKQGSQALQGRQGKPLIIPVHLVITSRQPEGEHLIRRQLPQTLLIDEGQLLRPYRLLLYHSGLQDLIHSASLLPMPVGFLVHLVFLPAAAPPGYHPLSFPVRG